MLTERLGEIYLCHRNPFYRMGYLEPVWWVRNTKVIKIDDVPGTEIVGELFSGKVTAKRPVTKDIGAQDLRLSIITFPKGVRNYYHSHEFDQALWILSGKGIVADEKNRYEALPGMVFFIPRGEKHWHGASEDSEFSHISILRPGKPTEIFKELS